MFYWLICLLALEPRGTYYQGCTYFIIIKLGFFERDILVSVLFFNKSCLL